MIQDCIFCQIIEGKIPSHKIYEDERILAFLDINPVNPGHTLVIPKTHSTNFLEISEADLTEIIKVIQKITPAITKAVSANSFNLGVNSGQDAGQVVFHTHFHIMPRFSDDGYKLWGGKPYEEGQAEEIAAKIKSNL